MKTANAKKNETLTQEALKNQIEYNPITGSWEWLLPKKGRTVGKPAGCLCKTHGYRFIVIGGVRYRANRLAYLYMEGGMPPAKNAKGEIIEIDHANGIKDDDRWTNLRICTRSQNLRNQKKSTKSSPYKGVYPYGKSGLYIAKIYVDGTSLTLGIGTAIECAMMYDAAAVRYFGKYARINLGEEAA